MTSRKSTSAQGATPGKAATNEPAFSETMQIGIVVPDVEPRFACTAMSIASAGGKIMEIRSENTEDARLYGRPVEWKSKIAVTMIGSVKWS